MAGTKSKTELAEAIADYLFKNGSGTKADRLLLIVEDYSSKAKVSEARYLGGWSKPAVRDAVLSILESAAAKGEPK